MGGGERERGKGKRRGKEERRKEGEEGEEVRVLLNEKERMY